MLTLHRASATIVTDENFSVKLKWVNPACYMDSIPGDVGLGLEISVNEYTRAEFGNPERFEKYTTGQDRKFPDVSVRFGGALLMAGTLVITNATHETYSGWLQSELGVLGTKQRDKFITEMDWKKDVTFVNKTDYNPAVDDYACVSIINPTFWEGKGAELQAGETYINSDGIYKTVPEAINRLTLLFREFNNYTVNKMWPTGFVDTTQPASVVSPFLFLKYAVDEIFRMNGFFVDQTSNPLADPFFQILVYNNYNIFRQEFTLEDVQEGYWDFNLNEWVDVYINKVTNMSWSFGTFNYANMVPKIPLKDFILGLQNWLNFIFVFGNDSRVKIINRNDIPEAEAYSLDRYFLGFWAIGERKDVTLKFIQEQDDNDGVISADWHDLSDRRTDFGDAVATKEDLLAIASPTFGELRLVQSENKIYEYTWTIFAAEDEQRYEHQTDVCEWMLASIAPQPLFYGDSEEIEEITTGCSTLQNYGSGTLFSVKHTQQPGNIISAKSLWSDFSLRFIPHGLTAIGGQLEFDGIDGLFNTHWKKWADFWKSRLPVEGEFAMPFNELYYVINNITQPYSTRHGKFLIEEMECDFQGDLMGNVKVKGYKL